MGLMKKLTSALVASSLVFSLVGTAFAAYTPAAGEIGAKRMVDLKLITGRDNGDLALNSEITRAELVTVIVRAFGKEDDAKLLKGSTIFPDIQNHWASGNIAMAVALVDKAGSDPIGMPDGTFAPDAKLTPAQAVAFLMKFLGQKADPNKAWPANYLDVAVEKGLITAEDKALIAPMLNDNATRGLVFYMFDRAFYSYQLPAGGTFYTTYVDRTAPELTVTEPAATTMDSKVTISGKATGATEVKVGGTKVTLAADGSFTYDFELTELKEYPISVVALDLAGNSKEASFTVTRTTGDAATVEATLDAQLVKAGAETALTVVVKDKNGNEIKDAAYDVEIEGEIGTFADGVFTAAAVPATGKITVTSGEATPAVIDVAVVAGDLAKIEVTGATAAKIGQAITFAAKGYDAAGNEVEVGNVTWSASKGGVISPTTGEFAGTASGNVTVTAKVGEATGEAVIAVYGDAAALAIAAPTGLIANGADTKTVEVSVVDASGSPVTNSAADVTLSVSGGNIKIMDGTTEKTMHTVKAVNGKATFTVKSDVDLDNDTNKEAAAFVANSATLSATSGTLTGALSTVSAVAPTVGSIQLVSTPAGTVFEANGSLTLNAKILDTTGVQMPAPAAGFSITLNSTNTTSAALNAGNTMTFAGNAFSAGNVTLTLNAVPGDIAISGTTTAGYAIQGLNLSTKIAGPAYKAVITKAPVDTTADTGKFSIAVAIQDSLGTTLTTNSTAKVQVTATHETSTVPQVVSVFDVTNGVASGDITLNTATDGTAQRKVGTWTFTAKAATGAGVDTLWFQGDDDVFVTQQPEAVKAAVTHGAANKLGAVKVNGVAAYTMVANGTQTATATVEVQDTYGNLVKNATNAVTFKTSLAPVAISGLNTTGVTVNAVNGVASTTITAGIAEAGPDTIVASAKKADNSDYPVTASATVSAQIVGAAAALEAPVVAAQTAGKDFTVSFKVMDASGTPRHVATDAGRAVSLEVLDGSTVVGTQTTTTADGLAKFTVNLTTAKSYTFKAKALFNGAEKSATTAAVAVKAAAPASVVLKADLTAVETGTVLTNGVYPVVKDAFGNTVATEAGVQTVAVADLAYTINGSTTVAPRLSATTGTVTYTAQNAAETVTIGDSDSKVKVTVTPNVGTAVNYDNLPVTTTSVQTYIAGPAYQLKLVDTPASFVAGADATVKVGIYDGAGNLKTGITPTAITLAKPDGVTNPDEILGGLTANTASGIATFTVTGASLTGTYTFEASSGSLVKATGIQVAATTGTATKVMVNDVVAADNFVANGSSVAVLTFRVTDANGNTVTNYSGTMNFTTAGTGATLLSTSAPISNGQAVVQVKATTQSGTFTVTPSIVGDTTSINVSAADAVASVTVKAGAPVAATSTKTVNTGNVYFVLRDAYGNAVTSGYVVEFEDGTDLTSLDNGMWTGAVGAHTNIRVMNGATEVFNITIN